MPANITLITSAGSSSCTLSTGARGPAGSDAEVTATNVAAVLPAAITEAGAAAVREAAGAIGNIDANLGFIAGTDAVEQYVSRYLFNGVGNYVNADTIPADVGTGTLTCYYNTSGTSLDTWQKGGGELNIYDSARGAGVKDTAAAPHTAGLTGIAYIRIVDPSIFQVRFGITSSSILSSGYSRISSGFLIGNAGGGKTNIVSIMDGFGTTLTGFVAGDLRAGDVIGVAIRLTADGYEMWMQGGAFANFGCPAHSASWVHVHTNTDGVIAGDLAFAAESQHGYGPLPLVEFATTTSFNPDDRAIKNLYSSDVYVTAHTANVHYAADGSLYATWWAGEGEDAGEEAITFLKARTRNGIWSDTYVVAGPNLAGSGLKGDSGGFLELLSGEIQFLYQRSTDDGVTYDIKRRTITVDSAGILTVGAESDLPGVSETYALTYQRPVRISHGTYQNRLIIPCNNATNSFMLYSDDEGVTWTETAHFGLTGDYEPAVVEEGADKVLVAYMRRGTSAGVYTATPRFVSSDGGATWAQDGTISPPCCHSRAQAVRLDSGLVAYVANDSTTNYLRNLTTIWILGDGGETLGKLPICPDPAPGTQNYPAIAVQGDKLAVIIPHKQNQQDAAPCSVLFAEQSLSGWLQSLHLRDAQNISNRAIKTLGSRGAEIIKTNKAAGAATSISTAENTAVLTMSLPAGTWDIEANVNLNLTGATMTEAQASIVPIAASTDGSETYTNINTTVFTGKAGITVPRNRVTVTATTTYYVTVRLVFSAGTVTGFGAATATRVY